MTSTPASIEENSRLPGADAPEELTSDQRPTGIEVERTSDPKETIKEPFDPEQIDVKTKSMVVDLIMARIRGGAREIDLMPDFQRRAGIWDDTRKSRLIESLLLRIPLPVFYVAANENECWSVVDGLQRITTLKEFIHDGTLRLSGLEFLRELNGKKFDELSRQMQRRILETEVTVNIIQPGTPSAVMFNIFKRINTGGLPLSAQEIRHAIKQGPATRLLKELAESQEFLRATRNSVKDERMGDRECILRFAAFWNTPPELYVVGDLDAFLVKAMDAMNAWTDEETQRFRYAFFSGMNRAREIFGKYAFRKYYGDGYRLSPINKALFETWGVNLARVAEQDAATLLKRREEVKHKAARLMDDVDFLEAISIATGSVSNVKYRFNRVELLLLEVLGDNAASP